MKSPLSMAVPAVLSLLLALLSGPAHPQTLTDEGWIRLKSEHFTFFTDGPEDVARSTAYDLERLRHVLTQVWPSVGFEAPVPTLLYVFSDEAAFHPYRLGGRLSSQLPEGPRHVGAGAQTAGYLVPHEHGNYAALVVASETRPVGFVFKQYIHHLLHEKVPALPLWLRHGLAEYYSTFEVEGDKAAIGLPIRTHLEWLARRLRWEEGGLSLAEVLAATELPAEPDAAARFFQSSWAMVHYLSSTPELRRQLGAFARQAASGAPVGRAFDESFDVDVATFEERLAAYLLWDTLTYLRVAIEHGAHPAQVFPLAPHETLHHLGDLLARAHPERGEDARAHFRRALEFAPDHGPSLAGLGYVAELAGDDATALALYEQAVEQARDHFLVEYLYGASLVRSLDGRRPASEPEEARLASAIAALERSVRLRPQFAVAWGLLGYAHSLDPVASAPGVEALEKAHGLLPGRLDVAFNLLLAYARVDDREAAEALIARMQAVRADAATLERSREVLLQMDFGEAVRLIRQQSVDDAIALFARIQAESRDPALQERAAAELEKFESTVQAQRFGDLYKRAVRLLSDGDFESAAAVLDEMADVAKPGRQQEAVEQLRQATERRRKLELRVSGPAALRGQCPPPVSPGH